MSILDRPGPNGPYAVIHVSHDEPLLSQRLVRTSVPEPHRPLIGFSSRALSPDSLHAPTPNCQNRGTTEPSNLKSTMESKGIGGREHVRREGSKQRVDIAGGRIAAEHRVRRCSWEPRTCPPRHAEEPI